jgi:holliday junction DNA helicase RuvA
LYDFIKGTITHIQADYIVIENNGIGYQIICANPYLWQNNRDADAVVYTYQYVREDVIALYGFTSRDEKYLFTKLISVSGIGPKGALAILAAGQPTHVIEAIESEDENFLTRFPGVGKKTARQIILDLKGKLTNLESMRLDNIDLPVFPHTTIELDEAMEALQALGYGPKEIKRVRPILENEEMTTDQFIKKALQLLLKS